MGILLAMLETQAEPAPAPLASTADTAIRAATQHPDLFLVCLAVGVPVAMGLAFGHAAIKHFLPAWVTQSALNREAAEKSLKAIRDDATNDAAAVRALAKEQQQHIVENIGAAVQRVTGQIEKLTDRSERHSDLLSKVAAKVGAGILVLLLSLGAAGIAQRIRVAIAEPALRCDPPCAAGQRCTPSGCQEIKTTTASRPHSALRYRGFANLASGSCRASSTVCP